MVKGVRVYRHFAKRGFGFILLPSRVPAPQRVIQTVRRLLRQELTDANLTAGKEPAEVSTVLAVFAATVIGLLIEKACIP